jgi:ribosomal-protein-alanine N-acetyltransferase
MPQHATPRLHLRELTLEDAPFILALVNEPSFLENIGDKGARDLEGARAYLQGGPLASYRNHGFGLLHVSHRETGEPMGICGLLRRPGILQDPDIGFAFFPRWWGAGYAYEAAEACMDWGHRTMHLRRILGVVKPGNAPSIRLLERLGMRREGLVTLYEGEPQDLLYARDYV